MPAKVDAADAADDDFTGENTSLDGLFSNTNDPSSLTLFLLIGRWSIVPGEIGLENVLWMSVLLCSALRLFEEKE